MNSTFMAEKATSPKAAMQAHTGNPSAWGTETRGSHIWGHLELHIKPSSKKMRGRKKGGKEGEEKMKRLAGSENPRWPLRPKS